jgi:hypothetical protein
MGLSSSAARFSIKNAQDKSEGFSRRKTTRSPTMIDPSDGGRSRGVDCVYKGSLGLYTNDGG